ncbi:hypothetical protein [Pseudarthrobacter phenanthrenivorans]|uniref:hypothetical protein n=1 Tax=Pseudarthrobacter phenanthrenivorans TaxID=361575 RepID=UPI00344C852C
MLLWLALIGLCSVFLLAFGFFFDRPSQVPARDNETLFEKSGRLLSAAFHVALSLFLLSQYGPVGFVHLPLAVMVTARRRSAARNVPLEVKALTNHVSEILGVREQEQAAASTAIRKAKVLRVAVLCAMVATALLGLLATFKLPVAGLILWTGGLTWALWMYIAWTAAGKNMAIETHNANNRTWTINILRQLCGGTAAEWADTKVIMEKGCSIATNIPLSAVLLRAGDADSILAQIAPKWELGECTPDAIVLRPASDDTLERRAESARSGGLIGGRVDWAVDSEEETGSTANTTVAPEELFS